MKQMPYQDGQAVIDVQAAVAAARLVTTDASWQRGLPVLCGEHVTLRELRLSDARSLLENLATEEVARFISPPPTTVDAFERFIAWSHRERARGRHVCFGVVPRGADAAIGIFQLRELEPGFATAEWGFAIGSLYWGTGVFIDAAHQVVDFAFEELGVHRLEARSAVENGRGNGALAKVGATKTGILRRSFLRDDLYLDQVLWTILPPDWKQTKVVWTTSCGKKSSPRSSCAGSS